MLVLLLASIQRLNSIATNWQRLVKVASDRYRPELHYMRGPGPKWHAKHRDRTETGVL
jgi:hypothetical protein